MDGGGLLLVATLHTTEPTSAILNGAIHCLCLNENHNRTTYVRRQQTGPLRTLRTFWPNRQAILLQMEPMEPIVGGAIHTR